MKHLFHYRTASLLLFFILLAQHSHAQGTEKVFEALWYFILTQLAVAGLALLFLVIFIVKRTKVMAVVSGVFGLATLLFGLWLAYILNRDNYFGLVGMLNLVLVFVFTVAFPKKQAPNPAQETVTDTQALPDRKADLMVKWITALFIFWFFYSLLGAVGFLGSLLRMNTYTIRMPDILLIAMEFLMALVLLAGLILFVRRRRAGWNLLLFTNMYSIASILMFTVRNVLYQHKGITQLPAFFFVSQGIIMLFLLLCTWLLTRPGVLILFGITKKSRSLSLLFSLAAIAAWIFLTQLIVDFLARF